jgi:hypothetical protein
MHKLHKIYCIIYVTTIKCYLKRENNKNANCKLIDFMIINHCNNVIQIDIKRVIFSKCFQSDN